MASSACNRWESIRCVALDEIEHAHATVGGTARGRRHATLHINQAYGVLLSSHFQGFCRDLHDESISYMVGAVELPGLRSTLRDVFMLGRKIDSGNPNPGNIGADFGRFGLIFWEEVRSLDARNSVRQAHVEDLNRWRNAIAHQSFDPAILGGSVLTLPRVRRWRQACHQLTLAFDEVMRSHIQSMTGSSPWPTVRTS